jgi:hypothetical protein
MILPWLADKILLLMRLPLFQVSLEGEVLASFRIWHYILYAAFEYFTLY